MKKALALAITIIAGSLIVHNWGTTEAVAWAVAFAGWLPHAFGDSQEACDGNQA